MLDTADAQRACVRCGTYLTTENTGHQGSRCKDCEERTLHPLTRSPRTLLQLLWDTAVLSLVVLPRAAVGFVLVGAVNLALSALKAPSFVVGIATIVCYQLAAAVATALAVQVVRRERQSLRSALGMVRPRPWRLALFFPGIYFLDWSPLALWVGAVVWQRVTMSSLHAALLLDEPEADARELRLRALGMLKQREARFAALMAVATLPFVLTRLVIDATHVFGPTPAVAIDPLFAFAVVFAGLFVVPVATLPMQVAGVVWWAKHLLPRDWLDELR